MLSWSAWDGPSLHSNITGATDGNGRQSSPTVGTMPTTTLIQLQTYLASLCSRTRMQHAVHSLHDFDSQVAWGILTKNRSSMLRFCRVVIRCIVPCLTVSYITLLEYSCTAEHPADRTSRAHGDVDNQSAGQSRGDISVHTWDDNKATTKIEAINYVSSVFYYLPQRKGKVPGSTRLLVTWSKCVVNPGTAAQHILIDNICG